ncbi:AAA family ATPase [Streptomyces radicis]|uniref:AAA+ ATPase domain-containing protein n=1 Tax=Streptomyces radicis TaxID=1750517 RepID=A0A3A9WMA1_9ACTN|nr:AAA family ATPase [Streptomyces radicis]RKN10604.1 hypothetical protein D7319_09285 [Streptomyces radicis]RKN24864.1 hypothetical protein D7318_10465 [Streptomyces radicis]
MEVFGPAIIAALANAMVTGAGQEAGRVSVAPLAALLGRMRRGRRADGDDGPPPEPTDDPAEMRRLAEAIVERARDDEEIAALLRRFAREETPERLAVIEPPYASFVNRDEAIAQVRELVAEAPERPRLLLIVGEAGIGKSALAVRLAQELDDLLPGDQLHVDLRGHAPDEALTPSAAATDLLYKLGSYPGTVGPGFAEQRALLQRRLRGNRALVILDNAESPEQVDQLVVGGPGSLFVVTTRHRMPSLVGTYGARVLLLGPLADTHVERLLIEDGRVDPGALAAPEARELVRRCGGHPARVWDVVAQLAHGERLEEIARAGAGGDPWPDPVERRYLALGPAAARLHRLLGQLPPVVQGAGPVAALAGLADEAEAEALLTELAERRLVEVSRPEGPRRYQQTADAHRHAVTLADPDAEAAVERWLARCLATAVEAEVSVMRGRWYVGAVARAQARSEPVHSRKRALDLLLTERAVLVAAVRTAAERERFALVWQLCEAMWGLHLRRGFHEDCLRTHALGIGAALAVGDSRALARTRVQRGFSLMALGQLNAAEADFRAAFAAERDDHPRGRATALESLGLLRLRQRRFADALDLFHEALTFAERAGDPRALALLAHHVGRARYGAGTYPEALRQLDAALAEMRALPTPDRYNEARVLTSLGEARLAAGDRAGARGPLDAALAIMADEEGALIQEAAITELRARCEDDAERRRELWQRARQVHKTTGDIAGEERVQALLRAEGPGGGAGR